MSSLVGCPSFRRCPWRNRALGETEKPTAISSIVLSLDLQPRNTVWGRWTSNQFCLHLFIPSTCCMPNTKLGAEARGRCSACLHRIHGVNRDERYYTELTPKSLELCVKEGPWKKCGDWGVREGSCEEIMDDPDNGPSCDWFWAELQPGPLSPEHFGKRSRLSRKIASSSFVMEGGKLHLINWFSCLRKQEQNTKFKNIQMCHKTEHEGPRFVSIKSGLFLRAVGRMSFVFLCGRKDTARSQDNERGCKWRLIFSVSPE